MDPSHVYGQNLSPSFAKHAENYHGGVPKFYLLWFNSFTFVKIKKKEGGKGTFKELTSLGIHQRWIFSQDFRILLQFFTISKNFRCLVEEGTRSVYLFIN